MNEVVTQSAACGKVLGETRTLCLGCVWFSLAQTKPHISLLQSDTPEHLHVETDISWEVRYACKI